MKKAKTTATIGEMAEMIKQMEDEIEKLISVIHGMEKDIGIAHDAAHERMIEAGIEHAMRKVIKPEKERSNAKSKNSYYSTRQ